MELYDTNKNGYIEAAEVASIMSDGYRAQNKVFNPNEQERAGGLKLLDS
jgi:Ca2+-binding EF-hand superfamily protein